MAKLPSLEVIKRKIRKLQAQAEKLRREEKRGVRQLRTLLRKFKLGAADIRIALDGGGRARRVSKLRGRKIKPKYRNPAKKSETWTGRGRMPLWMAGQVKKGKKPDDFLISKQL
jgi:DNA-binding protein H-NS